MMMMRPPIPKTDPSVPPRRVLQRKCNCGASSFAGASCASCADKDPKLQYKLAIGPSDDPFEREADRIAEQVVTAPRRADFAAIPLRVQRFTPSAADASHAAPASVDQVLRTSGSPLDAATREDMEQRFARDFSQVRIHRDGVAQKSAAEIGARAYTVGNSIVFGEGQFAPETMAGRYLLVHELTHTLQQASAGEGLVRAKLKESPTVCGGAWTCAASPCDQADPGREGAGGAATKWTLRVMVDIDVPAAEDVGASTVGHTYVEFEDSTGMAHTFGFYPDKSTGTPDPMFHPAVGGCVVHPDTNHKSCVDYTESFNLTGVEYQNALSFAQSYCKAPLKYHVLNNNCTTFAKSVAESAGRSLPALSGKVGSGMLSAVADNPNTLIEGLRKRDAGPTYALTSDSEIRAAIGKATPAELKSMSIDERIRVIKRLLEGWIADDDIAAIEKVCAATEDSGSRRVLQLMIGPLEENLWSAEQKSRLHKALFPG